MEPFVLTQSLPDGNRFSAVFDPDRGMNLVSFKKNDLDLLHPSHGFLIGPHFGSRLPHMYPGKASDPFPNGVGRFAAWKADVQGNTLNATLEGKDTLDGATLASLEGQNFKYRLKAELRADGLHLDLSIVSDTDSMVGLEIAWDCRDDGDTLVAAVGPRFLLGDQPEELEKHHPRNTRNELELQLKNMGGDFTFYPAPNPTHGAINLSSRANPLLISYSCICQENCWRLFKESNSPLAHIQLLSAQNPFSPNLTVSSLSIHLAPM